MNTFMRFVTGAVIGLLLGWNGRAAETVDLAQCLLGDQPDTVQPYIQALMERIDS